MENKLLNSLNKLGGIFRQLGDREPTTAVEAQAVIENIRAEKGHLDKEVVQELHTNSQRTQDVIFNIVKLKRETEAAYTTNISEQLYSSKYRFLYELIQNADDSGFLATRSTGVLPFLRFELRSDALTVETNEDGFTRRNIEAICATGRSSKKAAESDDHIGEKGFGFKSVFSVADEVHIQSGLWSFCFRHHQGDDGLGMVTPLDKVPNGLSRGVTTRITLQYSEEAKQNYARLLEAIQDIPTTTILFLRRIRKIHFDVIGLDGRQTTTTIKKENDTARLRGTIASLRVDSDGRTVEERCTYLLFRTMKQNMPHHERRKGRKVTEVELAFPVNTSTQQPMLSDSGQYVFAFLPLQRLAQLQFLINADFVTSASRESVIDCAWNFALCEEVAHTFVSAVTGTFATPDHALRYSWLDFLPTKTMENPWKSIYKSITESLMTKLIIQSLGGQFNLPSHMRILPVNAIHRDQPILPDLADEIYLAKGYTNAQKERMKELGLRVLDWSQFVDRLQADLVSRRSVLKTKKPADPWHEAFANLCITLVKSSSSAEPQRRFKRLSIIPLIGGSMFTGAPGASPGGSDKIYFAYTGTTPIPNTGSLRLLDRVASQNSRRKSFYKALGVEECAKEVVFAQIKMRHQRPLEASAIIDELRYLFYQRYDSDDIRTWIRLPLTLGATVKACELDLYVPSRGDFDMHQLVPSSAYHDTLPEALFYAEPLSMRVNNETWQEWLVRTTGAMYYPPLLDGTFALSSGLRMVLQHNPAKFLGTLRAHWHDYQQNSYLVEGLSECKVPCKFGHVVPLGRTYLPTSAIMAEIARLGVHENSVPLLDVPESELDESSYRTWKFLEEFDVTGKPDLGLYKVAIRARSKEIVVADVSEIVEIYKCIARLATIYDYGSIRKDFGSNPQIWDDQHDHWVKREQCILDGPDFISCRTVLNRTYEHDALLHAFFDNVLEIPSLKIGDILAEIELRRESTRCSNSSISLMRDIYASLSSEAGSEDDWREIKDAFTEKKLILGEDGIWYNLNACLWQSPFTLASFQDLSNIYDSLEGFFVRRLRVKKASAIMLINEVKRMAGEASPRLQEIRTRLIEIGMMLARTPIDDGTKRALNGLQDVKFLPKMIAGTAVLVGIADNFAIPDHQRYSDALAAQDVLLDLQVHEVQSLHTVFLHLGLTQRYLSAIVKEVSTVGEGLTEDETLSKQLHAKAYALYCCAAKYKSSQALRGAHKLYERLSQAVIYTTDDMTTSLVLVHANRTISVRSDRLAIHHDFSDGKLRLYVPADLQQRRACYRSQLPRLMSVILEVDPGATFTISSIISCSLADLEDVLIEQDVPAVEWIDKPTVVLRDILPDESLNTPISARTDGDMTTLLNPSSGIITPESSPTRYRRSVSAPDSEYLIETPPPEQYPELIEQVIESARQAGNRYRDAGSVPYEPVVHGQYRVFDHIATFGTRNGNTFTHDRRIGAAGEAYVFEVLSTLYLPNFTEANWRSTIRGELARSTRFADLANWVGRETADLVYKDETGELTRYLRDHSEGSFPYQIREDWDFQARPIEYYLEVKSTTGACGTRFYMSNGQYKRMEQMAIGAFEQPTKVYVIMRVFDLMTADIGMKIFVDPLRFRGSKLDFESEQWFVTTK